MDRDPEIKLRRNVLKKVGAALESHPGQMDDSATIHSSLFFIPGSKAYRYDILSIFYILYLQLLWSKNLLL